MRSEPLGRYLALGQRFQRLPRWAAALMAELAGDVRRIEDADVVLALELCEAQAILNALRESGVLDKPMIFQHVETLKQKVESAMRASGHNPL